LNNKQWKTIENWGDKGVGAAHNKGYRWFRRTFVPTLEDAEHDTLTPEREIILADAYYVLGDIHDLNDAPKEAAKAYLKSIDLCPSSGAWRELGRMYDNMGRKEEAIQCLHTALSIDPEDDHAILDLQCIYPESTVSPLYNEGDTFWEINELLAQNKADAALPLLKKSNSLKSILYRARVYGAQGDENRALKTLEKLRLTKRNIELEYGDWFYIPDALYDRSLFWELMLELHPRLSGVYLFLFHDSLSKSSEELANNRLQDEKNQELRLVFQYNLYRCRNDYSKMLHLHETFPKWKEPAKTLKKMGAPT